MKIKVGILLSYDYNYVFDCLKCIYQDADIITLAVDKDYMSWTGKKFFIEDDFYKKIEEFDIDHKIVFYKDNFYVSSSMAMELDTRERNMLACFEGKDDGWHIQIDSDEYFIDFHGFVEYLHSIEKTIGKKKVVVCSKWFNLFKKLPGKDGYLAINSSEHNAVTVATNYPVYQHARGALFPFLIPIETNFVMLHNSYARTEEDLNVKLHSWSHSSDFNVDDYFNFWKSVNQYNAPYIKNFHPLSELKENWKSLSYLPGTLDEIIDMLKTESLPQKKLTRFYLLKSSVKNHYHCLIENKFLKKMKATVLAKLGVLR